MTDGRSANLRRVAVFIILFAFWLVFSGHFDALHLTSGVVCSALVAAFSYDLLLPSLPASTWPRLTLRFLLYLPWLLYEIVLANLHVVYLLVRPGLVRPRVVRFTTHLKSELAQVTLGNSITLTPGTITMDIQDGEFHIHAVSEKAAESVITGNMERRVAHAFLEDERPVNPPRP